jgi:UDP-glucose 4-epimerase
VHVKAAVTGGAGFIGHHLVRALLERGDEVRVLDDLSTGRMARLDAVAGGVTIIEGSILDPGALDATFVGCDVVFHHAALVSAAESMLDPDRTLAVNEGGTVEVMRAATRNAVRRVVYAGSSAVYGNAGARPCREDRRPDPQSPYGISKLAAEQYVHVLGARSGIDTVALRYFNVYGPGQDPSSEYAAVIPRFIHAILAGERPVINGNGSITRDFVFIDDVVRANLLASHPSVQGALTCNIATGRATSLLDLIAAVCSATGREVQPEYGPLRPGDVLHSHADVALASRALRFVADVPLQDGIARTVGWFSGARG